MTSMPVPSKELVTINRASIAYRNGVRSFIQLMVTPQTTGRRGAAATTDRLRKSNPNTTRTDIWLACHTRKDGSTPTQESRELVDQVRVRMQQDPSARFLDLDHDPIAMVFGLDDRGWIRGVGPVSKTTLTAAGPYRDQLLRWQGPEPSHQAAGPSHQAAGSSHQAAQPSHQAYSQPTSQASFQETPEVRTDDCILHDVNHTVVAIGNVVGAAPGYRGLLNVRLRMICVGGSARCSRVVGCLRHGVLER